MIPATLGACADRLLELRELKAKQQRVLDALADEERAIREHLIRELPKSEAEGVVGHTAKAVVHIKQRPTYTDWTAVCDWVRTTGDFSILQHRLSEAAIRERWEAGETIMTTHTLTVPAGQIPPYTLSVGMYSWPSLERLPVTQNGQVQTDDVVTFLP